VAKGRVVLLLGLVFIAVSILALLAAIVVLGIRLNYIQPTLKATPLPLERENPYTYLGEKIIYEIRFKGLRLGKAEFNYLAKAEIASRPVILMTLETILPRFRDKENIYADPQTLLPLRVERDIFNWLSREEIREEYDQDSYSVTIIKKKGRKEERMFFKKSGPLQNAILLPHYLRRLPGLAPGMVFTVNLPRRELKIELTSREEVVVPAGTFQAFHFESLPKQIEIWLTVDERRIPLKIQGTGVFGYVMLMREYKEGQSPSPAAIATE
jgi:hypothetical protein